MEKETLLDTAYITMWYHPDKKIVHHKWHKFMQGKEVRNSMMVGTECMKKNKATKWLSDDRNFPVMVDEDLKWGREVWFPETIKAGWKFWAIVMPETPVGQINMQALIKQYAEAGITANIFTDPDEAMKWLEAQ